MRADAALRYLEQHPHTWIPVTTEETVDALKTLRRQGHRIVTRFEEDGSRQAKFMPPDPAAAAVLEEIKERTADYLAAAKEVFAGDIDRIVDGETGEIIETFPEPVVVPPVTPGMAGRPFPMVAVDDGQGGTRFELVEKKRCYCGDEYLIYEDHVQSPHHRNWEAGETQLEVPHPDQTANYKFREGDVPAHFELGAVVLCPTCKNKRLGERKTKTGIRPAATFSSAPGRPGRPCSNCNGNGMVPNIGPIVATTQGASHEPERSDEPAPGQVTIHDGPEALDPERAGELGPGTTGAGGDPDSGSSEPVAEGPERDHPRPKRRKPRAGSKLVSGAEGSGS